MSKFHVSKILFDLDGTLIDTAGDLHAATNHVLKVTGRPEVPLSLVRPYVGFGALKLIEVGFTATGGIKNGETVEDYKDSFLDYYQSNIAVHSTLFAGGNSLLESLKDKEIPLAICTNKSYALAEILLKELGLFSSFDIVLGGDSLPYRKPDPRHLTDAIDKLPGNGPAIMVGDSSPDILAAQNAGIPVIAAEYGYHDMPLSELKPDATIKSLGKLEELLVF